MKYILPSIALLMTTSVQAELIIHQAPFIKGVVAEPIATQNENITETAQPQSQVALTQSSVIEPSVNTAQSPTNPVLLSEAQPVQAVAPQIVKPTIVSSVVTDETENRILGLKYAEGAKPFVVFAEAGILGLGFGAGFSINSYLDLVAGYNSGKYKVDALDFELMSGMKVDKVDFDSKVQYVAANIRPFAGSFHLTLGLFNQDIKFKGQYSPSDFYLDEGELPEYTFNHATFDANQVGNVHLDVDFNQKVLPYVGIGWSPKISQRWGLATQFGAMYAGKPQVSYYPENGNLTIQDQDKTTTLGEALKVEEDNFSTWLKWIPVAKIGLWVRF